MFDPVEARKPKSTADVGQIRTPPEPLSVSVLVSRIKNALAEAFGPRVCVVGEISNFSSPTSGHLYFSLKDANAAIGVAMWKARASKLKFRPADGMEVVVEGKVDVYDAQGKLQLYAERITPRGAGALELALRQLTEKLRGEGLFDQAAKKPLARFPRAVGIITSATGAAVRDIQRTLQSRWPAARLYLLPAAVQGEGAAGQIAQAVRNLDANAPRLGIDTIILARGGGSLEDLWAFNEEVLARAIFSARAPIISGVGHEVDVTVCDLVADARGATPTAAAALAVPDGDEVRRAVEVLAGRLERRGREVTAAGRLRLQAVMRSSPFRDPTGRLRSHVQRIDELSHRLRAAQQARLSAWRGRLEPLAHRLTALHPARLAERALGRLDAIRARLRWALGGRSKHAGDALGELRGRLEAVHPRHRLRLARQQVAAAGKQLQALSYRSVLKRGFSVTRAADGKLLRSVGDVRHAERIETELTDGRICSDVVESESVGENDKSTKPDTGDTKNTKKVSPMHQDRGLFD